MFMNRARLRGRTGSALSALITVLLITVSLFTLPAPAQFTNINTGATANDATGDSLRAAFQKVNLNFSNAFKYPTPRFSGSTNLFIHTNGATAGYFLKTDGSNAFWAVGGSGSVSDPLRLGNGSASAPSFSFTSDPTCGVFRVSSGVLGLQAPVVMLTNGVLRLPDSDFTAPTISFMSTPGNGIYHDSSDNIAFKTTYGIAYINPNADFFCNQVFPNSLSTEGNVRFNVHGYSTFAYLHPTTTGLKISPNPVALPGDGWVDFDYLDGVFFHYPVDLGGNGIYNVASPLSGTDAANKNYVDLLVGSLGAVGYSFDSAQFTVANSTNVAISSGARLTNVVIKGTGLGYGLRLVDGTSLYLTNGGAVFGSNSTVSIGTSSAGTASLRFGSGAIATDYTATESWNFRTVVGGGKTANTVAKLYDITNGITRASAVLDFPSTAAGSASDLSISALGVGTNDIVTLGVPLSANVTNGTFYAWPSNDTVWVRFQNGSGASQNPGPGLFKVKAEQ